MTLTIITFFGGVMLMLYGIRLAGEGLQKSAGGKLKSFLLKATSNRFKSLGVGAVITGLLQSSSATTVMLVGFVGAGLIGLNETMGIILGADIGTTLTVQIIAFKVYDYAPLLVGVGILMVFLSKGGRTKDAGLAVLGFGFVFYALKILIATFEPVSQNPLLRDALLGVSSDPLAGIIISALLTAIFQSSAATLGLAITAAHTGLLSLDAAMPIVLGANIGTCATALLASVNATVDAKRVAMAHVIFKIFGVIIVLPFLGTFTRLTGLTASELPRQVANAHTLFNIGIAVLFLPFTVPFTNLVKKLVPERAVKGRFAPNYLDPMVLTSPTLALAQSSRECIRQSDIVRDMLRNAIAAFETEDMRYIEKIEKKDDYIDILDREIKLYLTKVSRAGLNDGQARREIEIILFSDTMENIGDVIDKNLMEMARKRLRKHLTFSKEGLEEIKLFHSKVVENFELGVAAFTESDYSLAKKLADRKQALSEMERELRDAHIKRLHAGLRETVETISIHLDILANLKRINSYITNIAYPILEREKK
ncbi:MAG: Na/Pi cotransporter family protein [Thermodesulfobacteriota bacterium]|nr:MAG: Na/Pi cotransporter family protein [Thermodesulfobacteriota bacterium]